MKCPKCGEELKEGTKFCTKCGVNLEQAQEEIEEKKREEENLKRIEQERLEEAKKKEEEDKLKLQELREEEKNKNEEEFSQNTDVINKQDDFQVKKEEEKPQKEKKIKKKKGFFRRLIDRIILIIIIAVILVGGTYYLYKQEMLPEVVSTQIDELIEKFEFVKDNAEKIEDTSKKEENEEKEEIAWKVEPTIEADDIIELNNDVSIIEKDKKVGLVSNKNGKVVLDIKYDSISYVSFYKIAEDSSKSTDGIVIQEGDKYYSIDSKYQKNDEVAIVPEERDINYYYDHNDDVIYEEILACKKYTPVSESSLNGEPKLKVCTNLEIVAINGKTTKDDDLTLESFEIDYDKTKIYDKGYFDLTTGMLITDCDYEEAEEFSEGVAAVKKDGKAGFIDEDENVVVDFKFDRTRSVHNGLAWAEKDGKWGMIKVRENK